MTIILDHYPLTYNIIYEKWIKTDIYTQFPVLWIPISNSESNSELERELEPFVEQARAKAKEEANAILAARVAARATASDSDSELSELQSSDVEVKAQPPMQASPASPALQLRPKRARKVPIKYR
jgi:hypothetical protein